MKKFVAFQIMIALVIGALIGHFFPDFGMASRPIGDGFIRLIKMIVVPIVFSTIVIGAAGSGGMKKMGSLGLKTIIWFEVITTIVLGIGLLLANVLKPGVGLDFSKLAKKDIGELDGAIRRKSSTLNKWYSISFQRISSMSWLKMIYLLSFSSPYYLV